MNVIDILDELELRAMEKTRTPHPDEDVRVYREGHSDGTLLACRRIRTALAAGTVPTQAQGRD